MSDSWSLTARWIFPIEGPPLERGVVTVADAHISAVEPRGARMADLDLGNVAVLPGLVNAHTHLDLSGLRQPVPFAGDFTAWLAAVIAHRRSLTPAQVEEHVRAGLVESLEHGVTLLGDIAGGGLSWTVLASAPVRAVVFYELLGLKPSRADEAWTAAQSWIDAHPPEPSCRPGLSPHAPYSVSTDLFARTAELARQRRLPVAIHLGETQIEEELLRRQQGPFVAFLESLGVWDPTALVRGAEQVLDLNAGVEPLLLAHGNYLQPHEVRGRSATVVYCPRTHAYFGHARHPLPSLLAQGTRVALGTDSRASNPDLDLLAEVRFLHSRYPELTGATLLRLATRAGAEALGWASEVGSLTPGKEADLMVVSLPDRDEADPHDLLLKSSRPVRQVMVAGRWVILTADR
jgi:cytosine/adenosine deaminase-related metal-dependent hydrolase